MNHHALQRHYVCLCTEDEDLDITIESNLEDQEEAVGAVIAALLERERHG